MAVSALKDGIEDLVCPDTLRWLGLGYPSPRCHVKGSLETVFGCEDRIWCFRSSGHPPRKCQRHFRVENEYHRRKKYTRKLYSHFASKFFQNSFIYLFIQKILVTYHKCVRGFVLKRKGVLDLPEPESWPTDRQKRPGICEGCGSNFTHR